jgi:NitT/TauT family transport system ATP-binding protein
MNDAAAVITPIERATIDAAPAIEARDLGMRFTARHGETNALADTSFAVGPSQIVSLIGPSGCGKSTILNLIAGFDHPTSGWIKVDGTLVKRPGSDRAMVFQTPALFPWFTVLENVIYGPKRLGVAREKYLDDARSLIDAVGLTGFERHYPYQLSGGMAQRTAIARALIGRPRVLLLDEPFGALDAQTRLIMQLLLLQIWEQYKTTIVFVTHDVEEAVFLSDRVMVMEGRPGTISMEVVVDLPRPRTVELLTTPAFGTLRRQILGLMLKDQPRLPPPHP